MNLNKFLFASIILAGMMACNKEDIASEDNGNGGELEGAAYMSLSISMPKDNASRATTESGTEGEQKVSNLSVFIWPTNPSEEPLIVRHFEFKDLKQSGNLYTTSQIPVGKTGNHRVAVIVNGYANEAGKKTLEAYITTPQKLREVQTLDVNKINNISKPGYFLMTNATTTVNQKADGSLVGESVKKDGEFYEDGTVSINVTGSKTNPTKVTVPVERSVAKIQETTTNYELKVTGTDNDYVVFQQVALMNANTKFYLIKQIRPIENTQVSENLVDYTKDESKYYIVDPNFSGQKSETKNEFLFNQFKSEQDIQWNNLVNGTAGKVTFYSLENTMTATEQMNAFTTGLYYKAQYKVKNQVGHVYSYYGKVYNWSDFIAIPKVKEQLKALNNGQDVSVGDESKFTSAQLKNIAVKYDNGICYYPYWIRHIPNPKEMAPMEFGVVRNNWYKMTINSVKGIGSITPENPDPQNPDENPDTMLEITVQVMPWTVRNNGIDF